MNFILRGILTLKEKKGRTFILLGLMLTVCVVILASFGIQSGANAAAVLARQKLGAVVTVSQDMNKMMEKQRENNSQDGSTFGERKRLTMEKKDVPIEYLDLLKENEHVTGYYLSNSTGANLTELLPVGKDKEEGSTNTQNNTENFGRESSNNKGMEIPKGMHMVGDVTIEGINNFNMSTEYVNGESVLTDGQSITEDDLNKNLVMVEKTFADENSLAVGSTFSIQDTEGESITSVEVKGIYTSSKQVNDNGFRNTAQLPYNTIIAPYSLVSTINGESSTTGVNSIKFYLDDPMNVDSFVEAAKTTAIDFDTYTVDGGTKEYESMMKPIENVASFSKTTIIIVSIFGAVILALIIILSIKDRISEIGMLMALGEKRIKVIGQFLTEALVVLIVAFGISIFAGNAISNKIGDTLLQKELTTTESSDNQNRIGRMPQGGNMNFAGNNGFSTKTVEKIDKLDISISSNEIAKMAGLSFVIVVLATIVPSIMIMRYNPKTILSKHS